MIAPARTCRPLGTTLVALTGLLLLLQACGSLCPAPRSLGRFEGRLLAAKTPVALRLSSLRPGQAYRLELYDRFRPSAHGKESASTKSLLSLADGSRPESYLGTHDDYWYSDDPGGIVVEAFGATLIVSVETGKEEGLGTFGLELFEAGAQELARARRSSAVVEGLPSIRQGLAVPKAGKPLGGFFLHGSSVVPRARDLQGAAAGGGLGLFLTAEEGRFSMLAGVETTEALALSSRPRADSPHAARVAAAASSVFVDGGDQAEYVRAWKGSAALAELNRALRDRRVPYGGNSAGLAVAGEFVYAALHSHDLVSAEALADPFGPWMTLERDFLSVPGLEGALAESHYSQRGRQGRLVAFLARILAEGWSRPGRLYGIGVDEGAALALGPDGKARAYGSGSVWLLFPRTLPDRAEPGRPLEWKGRAVDAVELRARPEGGEAIAWPPAFDLPATLWYAVGEGRLVEGR